MMKQAGSAMGGGAQAAGGMATAAMAAAVIDAERTGHGGGQGAPCLNCGTPVTGDYCSRCGQKAHVHRSMAHVVEELLHGVTHFDSRFWRTLPMLMVRPGKLTRDYVMGQRQRYIAPVALFLLTVFAMFLVFGLASSAPMPAGAVTVNRADAAEAVVDIDRQIARIDADLAVARADPGRAESIGELAIARAALVAARTRAQALAQGSSAGGAGVLSDILGTAAQIGGIEIETGVAAWDAKARNAFNNPELIFYKMQQKGYKLSFLFIPLSLPWLMLVFAWKREVYVYDHVVFLLYSLSFMSILFMVVAGLYGAGLMTGSLFGILFGVLPLAHIFAQLKEGYALVWWSAAWRTMFLSIAAVTTLLLYTAIIVLLGMID